MWDRRGISRAEVIREICVHLDQDRMAPFDTPSEPGPVRRAEPGLGGPAQDLDLTETPSDLVARMRASTSRMFSAS